MKFFLFVMLCYLPLVGYGQTATKNNDLRKRYNLFLIKDMQGRKTFVYKMNSSNNGQFNFIQEEENKIIGQKKVNSADAQKLDDLFVDKFISFKYLMNKKNEKECKESFYLNLRGEELSICNTEKEKIKEVKKLLEKLKVIL